MQTQENNAEVLDGRMELPGAATPGSGAGSIATGATSCRCARCGLYKWYPPLLLLSTLMAGIFCCLYITKPVFLSQPGETRIPQVQPAYQEQSPNDRREPPTAQSDRTLDPAGVGLPGEEEELAGGGDIVEALVDGFEPVVVERDGPPLFEPFVVNEEPGLPGLPDGESSAEGERGPGLTEADEEDLPVLVGENGVPGIELIGPPRPGSMPRSDNDDYRMRASFIAEFVDPAQSLAGPGAGAEPSEPTQ